MAVANKSNASMRALWTGVHIIEHARDQEQSIPIHTRHFCMDSPFIIHTNIRQACRDGSATIVSADRGGGVIVWDYTTHSVTKMAPNQNTVS